MENAITIIYKPNNLQKQQKQLHKMNKEITELGQERTYLPNQILYTETGAYPAANGSLITALTASALTGALPAISGASLTTISSSALTGALPAISGANLTSISSSALTGSLPAISGASLTSLTASSITGALPAISGASLTNLPDPSFSVITTSADYTITSTNNTVVIVATNALLTNITITLNDITLCHGKTVIIVGKGSTGSLGTVTISPNSGDSFMVPLPTLVLGGTITLRGSNDTTSKGWIIQ